MKVHKVYVQVVRDGGSAVINYRDLIFTTQGPFLVLEWVGESPKVGVLLDPAELRGAPFGLGENYVYRAVVTDPRPGC